MCPCADVKRNGKHIKNYTSRAGNIQPELLPFEQKDRLPSVFLLLMIPSPMMDALRMDHPPVFIRRGVNLPAPGLRMALPRKIRA
jgi:hypothetical protein